MLKDRLITAFAAFTLSNSFVINYFSNNGMENIATIISSYALYLITFLSFFQGVCERRYRKPLFYTILLFSILVLYEREVDYFHTVKQFEERFFIHGISGFVIGLTMNNVRLFVKYIAVISSIYLLILITEPINHAILHMNEMLTGYLMVGLTINLILAYYTVFKGNKLILLESVILTIIISLFSSRGCGVSLVSTWLLLYFWNKKRMGIPIHRILIKFTILSFVLYFIFMTIVEYLLGSGLELQTGSFLEKLSRGYVVSSNGRDEVYDIGFGLLFISPFTGLGFGADRIIEESFFVHNIILELCINFGIPLACILLFLYWKTIIKSIKLSPYFVVAFLILAQILKTWVQLLFSSSYLYTMLPLMFIIGLSLNARINYKKNQYE